MRFPSLANRAPTSIGLLTAIPFLVAYNIPPSATFFNQVVALLGWGGFLLVIAVRLPRPAGWGRGGGPAALIVSLGLLVIAALAAPLWSGLPWPLALSNAGMLVAALLTAMVAIATARAGHARDAFMALCLALLVAGVASAGIGMLQVYAPQLTDGHWIARTSVDGRAVGNVRQPNHLSSLLLWSIVAAIWFGESGTQVGSNGQRSSLRRGLPIAIAAWLLYVVVLTGSRTGALGTVTLALWGVLDRKLTWRARLALMAAPFAYAVMWFVAAEVAHLSQQTFGGESRFRLSGDFSSSRFAIWSNTWDLVKAHPLLGVGFGEFNFAWTLTPFPQRPREFFDHAHDLPLQLAAELGVPLAVLVLGLLMAALVVAVRNAVVLGREPASGRPPPYRAAVVMVLLVAVHSMLEYPLWYSYFLLPASFAFGLCLGVPGVPRLDPPRPTGFNNHPTRPLVIASMFLILGATLAFYDYMRVVVIFAPPARASSLEDRIADGRRSWLFAHHADYAAATTAAHPSEAMSAFERAPHFLLDARLMMAWATALDEAGDTDRARYIAARLREFHNDQAEAFFAVCNEPPGADGKRPFQCEPPVKRYTYRDFR